MGFGDRPEIARRGGLILTVIAAAVFAPVLVKAITEWRSRRAIEAAGMHAGTEPSFGGLVHVVTSIYSGSHHTVHDTDVILIERSTGIQNIRIENSELTDEGLDRIGRLPTLAAFSLWQGKATDQGVRRFRPCEGESLRSINLNLPHLSDGALATLVANNRSLTEVSLSGTGAGPRTLAAAANLPNLSLLGLQETGLTNDDLSNLPGHPHLVFLDLRGTRLTSLMPHDPRRFPSLRWLLLNGTAVSREEADRWEATLPGLRVVIGVK